MSLSIEIFAIGDPEAKVAIENAVRETLGAISGEWRVSVIGSQLNDIWELKIRGPNLNRQYKLYGTDGQHDPEFVRALLGDSLVSRSEPAISFGAPVADSWARLSNALGDVSDVQKVGAFIAEKWSRSSADFSVEQKWGRLSAVEEVRLKTALEKEGRGNLQEFEALIRGVASGPVALNFFSALGRLPAALKRIGYAKGFRCASDENRVLILCALAKESQGFIDDSISELPGDWLLDSFRSFIKFPRNPLGLSNEVRPELAGANAVDLLFGLSSLKIVDQREQIDCLSAELKSTLCGLAIRLIQTTPDDHFGRFARVRLSVFVCLAACLGTGIENAKLVLVTERHPSVIDVLTLTDDFRALRTLLEQLGVSTGSQHPEYTAALIDSLRARQLESLARATDKLDSWSKSRSSLLRIASQAALLRLERVNTKDFEKGFFTAGRSKDRDLFGQWVLRNPEFLEGINLAKLPRGLWKSLLSATASEPKLAHLLIEAKSNASDADRYWEDSIEIIGKIGSAEADELFNGLIHRKLQHGF